MGLFAKEQKFGKEVVKDLGGCLVKWNGISFINVKQVEAGWCWGDAIHVIGSFIKQSFNVVDHSEFHLTWVRKVDHHPKVIMDLAASNGQRGFLTEFALEVSDDIGDHSRINM